MKFIDLFNFNYYRYLYLRQQFLKSDPIPDERIITKEKLKSVCDATFLINRYYDYIFLPTEKIYPTINERALDMVLSQWNTNVAGDCDEYAIGLWWYTRRKYPHCAFGLGWIKSTITNPATHLLNIWYDPERHCLKLVEPQNKEKWEYDAYQIIAIII